MDFYINKYAEIPLWGDVKLAITKTTISTWFAMAVLIALGIIVRVKVRKFKAVPETRFQNIIELLVEMFENFNINTVGEKYKGLGNWFFGIIALIWVMNMEGLIGFRPATADLSTTAAFAVATFVILHAMWLRSKKVGGYLKEYIEPVPIFLPFNILGELSLPIALAFRLFGNIFGGLVVMGLIYGMFPVFLKIGVPAVLHVYFDAFAGSLQAFIFTILSMTFIRTKLSD